MEDGGDCGCALIPELRFFFEFEDVCCELESKDNGGGVRAAC